MDKLTLALAAAATLGAAATLTAYAGITMQGPRLTGVTPQSVEAGQPVATTVTLRSGETVVLRPPATD